MEEELTAKQRFEKEVGPISFQELQKFFAKGMMIVVNAELNLVDVALKIHEDDVSVIQRWINEDKITRAHDEHAKHWVKHRSEFNAVTVAPWVLVQEMRDEVIG